MNSCLYRGTLLHVRHRPVRHEFRYPVSMFCLDLDELPDVGQSLGIFGVNRARPVSFWDRDHVDGRPGSTREKIRQLLDAHGMTLGAGRVRLVTQCRRLGYVFNPASFYLCADAAGRRLAVVAEVHNTFGERYLYVLPETGRGDGVAAGHGGYQATKAMHVSPFVSMQATYRFFLPEPHERLSFRIVEEEGGTRGLDVCLWGRRRELTRAALVHLLLREPLLTYRIIAGIHWQAARLFLKRVPLFRQPPPSPAQLDQRHLLERMSRRLTD